MKNNEFLDYSNTKTFAYISDDTNVRFQVGRVVDSRSLKPQHKQRKEKAECMHSGGAEVIHTRT
jgi:hypothetical protein